MLIYIITFIAIFVIAIIFRKKKKIFCILSGIILWGLLAFRDISMGISDTKYIYYPFFEMIFDMNFNDILSYKFMSDKFFYILMKIISLYTDNYQICIAILAIPFVVFIMNGIYKYSKNPFMSTIIFIALYYAYGFFLLRQVIAIGIVFYSFRYITEKKLAKFILTIIIASFFHRTALILLIAYPIGNYWKFGYKNYFFILIAFIFGKYIFNFLIQQLNQISFFYRYTFSIQNGYYTVQEDFSMWGLLITVLILMVSDVFYRKSKEKNESINTLLNLSTLGSIFYCFTPAISEFYRLAMYFGIFNILLLPNALKYCKDKKTMYVVEFVLIVLFIGYFLTRTIFNTNIYPYVFYR